MVTAIAPPTMIATIGTSNGPRLTIESTSLTRASYYLRGQSPRFFGALRGTTEVAPFPFALTTEFLVELTGIEPVASWLQTRRSPS
jgi:hypothetical protein